MRWLRKAWGEFVGPEATAVDNTIAISLGALGAVIAPTPIQRLAAADLWGGVWANNTKACARWYGLPGQTDADYLKFAALHVHPAVLARADRAEQRRVPGWVWASALRLPDGIDGGDTPPPPSTAGTRRDADGRWSKLLLGHASSALWPDSTLRD